MTALEGVRLDNVPRTPTTRRTLPTPFTRPSISVGVPPAQRRRWMHLAATYISVGDIIANLGTVTDVVESAEDPMAWSVTVTAGAGNTRTFHGAEPVWVFTTPST